MTITEQIQYKVDRGMSVDKAISDLARAEYFRFIHISTLSGKEYKLLYEQPLLEWVENNDTQIQNKE